MARTLVASDDFNRADGAIGANWLVVSSPNTQGGKISSNKLSPTGIGTANTGVARWSGSGTFSNDQYAKIRIALLPYNDMTYRIGVVVRCSADTGASADYYFLNVYCDGPTPGVKTHTIGKVVNGTRTALTSVKTISWAAGDTIELEAEGSTLRAYRNGALIDTLTDSDLASGKPGFIASGSNNQPQGDDWEGGSLGVAGATVTLSPDPATVQVGGTRALWTNRSVAAPAGGVTYNLTSSDPAVATVPATTTINAGATVNGSVSATGVSAGTVTITATNAADSSETDSVTLTVSAVLVKKLKILAHIDALGASAVSGDVHLSDGTYVGAFTGQAFDTVGEAGKAPLKVDASSFSGGSLTTSDTLNVSWSGTSSATSALGNAVGIGSVGQHSATVIEE